jgi:putative FmdB family regulatory protein
MPTYVYECRTCHKTFETEQRITADPLTDCDCGAKGSLRRLIQPTAVMFKGGGFHINDYAPAKPSDSAQESTPVSSGEPAAVPAASPPKTDT